MSKLTNKLITLLFVVLTLVMISPFVYMLVCSFQEAYSPYLISFDFADYTLENYRKLFRVSGFSNWVFNSVFVSTTGVILTLAICGLAGYAFAKLRFRGKDKIFFFLFAAMIIPFPATVVPLWIMMGKLGWAATFQSLILPIPTFLGVVLFRQGMMAIPEELLESARMDGCSDFRIFRSIVLPLIVPTILSVAIIYFARSWNSLLWPLIMADGDTTSTLPVGLASLQGTYVVNYGLVMAGAVVNFLPPFLVYILLQKYFVSGAVSSGLKL